MAHAGQEYRLAFRRDFNLNVDTNRHGWANQYDLHVATIYVFAPSPLDNTNWRLGPMADDGSNVLSWMSDVQHHGGRDWQWQFTDTISGVPAMHTRHVHLFSPPGHLVADWTIEHNPTTDNTFDYGSAVTLIYFDPAVLSQAPIQNGASGPVAWADE